MKEEKEEVKAEVTKAEMIRDLKSQVYDLLGAQQRVQIRINELNQAIAKLTAESE